MNDEPLMTSSERRSRQAALLALAPLLVVAVGLFVPPILVRTRPRVVPIAPWDDGWTPFWSIPLVAAALAVVTLVSAWRRRAPGRLAAAAASAGIAWCAYPSARLIRYLLRDGEALDLAVVSAAILVAALTLAIVAWRHAAWTRWLHLAGAFALAASLFGCPLVPGLYNLFSGGVTFVAADATLLILVARAQRRAGDA